MISIHFFCHYRAPTPFVIPAFIAGTHSSTGGRAEQWVAGINPAMTKKVRAGMEKAGEYGGEEGGVGRQMNGMAGKSWSKPSSP